MKEFAEKRPRDGAAQWQKSRLRELVQRIEADGFKEASQSEIDLIFAEAEERDGSMFSGE